jgi:signal transduction histidine kinase
MMPKSSLEALSHETKVFSTTLELLKNTLLDSSGKSTTGRRLEGLLDDLENIILAASTGMPQHIAQKAKLSFKALREEISLEPTQSPEFIQLSARLNSQASLILRRVENLLSLGDGNDHKSANGIILAQEEERKRISREIHDGPAQTLASLTMRIDYCLEHEGLPDKLLLELEELKQSVIRSLKDIRRFIFDLRPMALDDLGLIPTLEQFISGFKQSLTFSNFAY